MSAKEMVEQANVLSETPDQITLSTGQTVEVYKCRLKQVGPVLGLLSRLLSDLGVVNIDDDEKLGDLEKRLSDPSALLQLIAKYSEEIPVTAALLTSMSEDQVSELELEDALALVTKVWEVNSDFFSKQILPLLGKAGIVQETGG
jgi:hypothetical protein